MESKYRESASMVTTAVNAAGEVESTNENQSAFDRRMSSCSRCPEAQRNRRNLWSGDNRLQQGDYEELDQMNAAKPYTNAAFRVSKAEDIGIGIARPIRAAMSGRPRGVYLDLTAAVIAGTIDAEAGEKSLVRDQVEAAKK
jgi:hypothetical protein